MKTYLTGLLILGMSACAVAAELPIFNLHASSRNGQVFLCWEEKGLPEDAELKVYSHNAPITAETLRSATLLAEHIQRGSARDWWRDMASFTYQGEPPQDTPHGFVIETGGDELPPTSGLHVHTVWKEVSGKRYYAVVWSSQGTNHHELQLGANSLAEPVTAAVAQPAPIWLGETANAPQQGSGKGKAVVINLHGRGGGCTAGPKGAPTNMLWFASRQQAWREGLAFKFMYSVQKDCVVISPYDRIWVNRKVMESPDGRDHCPTAQSFWLCYNTRIYEPMNKTPELVIDNFTEKYLLGLLDWAQAWLGTDVNRVYFQGNSMGASGSVSMALHFPERIAAIMADVPVYSYTWLDCKTSHAITMNRLVCSCGPLKTTPTRMVDGTSIADYGNGEALVGRSDIDIPPIFAYNGRNDASIPWINNPPFYASANKARQAFAVFWNNGNHGMGRTVPEDAKKWRELFRKYRLDLSYPAFSNCSDNKNYGNGQPDNGDIIGWINRGFDWNVLKDTTDSYAIELSISHPEIAYPVTADVTIRRRQQFKVNPGEIVSVQINGKEQPLTINADGLLTIPAVRFADAGKITLEITSAK